MTLLSTLIVAAAAVLSVASAPAPTRGVAAAPMSRPAPAALPAPVTPPASAVAPTVAVCRRPLRPWRPPRSSPHSGLASAAAARPTSRCARLRAVRRAPSPPSAPPLLSPLRLKLSAGDLLSAESILEVYGQKYGEDGLYLEGLGWLARGALLLGDRDRAWRYAAETRRRCEARLAAGADLAQDDHLPGALGAAIEVEAQLRLRERGRGDALRFLDGELARARAPVALRARIEKRRNLIALEGAPAPELVVEDFVGERPQSLAALRGRPVLLFVWAEGCGDCRAQAASLARAAARWRDRGLQVVTLTRHYDDDHAAEKERMRKVWAEVYHDVGDVPMVISTASMERYGGSSTPTFVFLDRAGTVRRYTPTRLTEAELDRTLATLCR